MVRDRAAKDVTNSVSRQELAPEEGTLLRRETAAWVSWRLRRNGVLVHILGYRWLLMDWHLTLEAETR